MLGMCMRVRVRYDVCLRAWRGVSTTECVIEEEEGGEGRYFSVIDGLLERSSRHRVRLMRRHFAMTMAERSPSPTDDNCGAPNKFRASPGGRWKHRWAGSDGRALLISHGATSLHITECTPILYISQGPRLATLIPGAMETLAGATLCGATLYGVTLHHPGGMIQRGCPWGG